MNILPLLPFLVLLTSYFVLLKSIIFYIKEDSSFSNYGVSIDVCVYNCRREKKHFDVHFRRSGAGLLLSEDGKNASNEGGIECKRCFYPARVGNFFFIVNMINVLFRICTLT